jgi:predicted dehydrogenase
MVHGAVAARKHVLCEKPLALTTEQVDALCASSERSDRLHLVNHQLRYHPCIREMRDRIRQGDIGRPCRVHLRYVGNRYVGQNAVRREWWFRSALGGGMILAMGPHLIDLVQFWFGGGFSSVQATAAKVLETVDLADGRTVTVDAESAWTCSARLADGTAVDVSCTAVSHREMSLEAEVRGTEGDLRFRSPGHLELVCTRAGGREATTLCSREAYEPADGTLFQHAFYRYASAIAEAVRVGSRRSVADATDFADYAYKHRVLEAIRRSAAEDRVVHIGPAADTGAQLS